MKLLNELKIHVQFLFTVSRKFCTTFAYKFIDFVKVLNELKIKKCLSKVK